MTSQLTNYNESVTKARKIREEAATTAELTRQMKPTTTFNVPADGIATGTLLFQLRSHGAVNVKVTSTGTNHIVTTTNPVAVAKILKVLGLVATVDGAVTDLQALNAEVALNDESTTGVIGESYIARCVRKLKKSIMR